MFFLTNFVFWQINTVLLQIFLISTYHILFFYFMHYNLSLYLLLMTQVRRLLRKTLKNLAGPMHVFGTELFV